MQYKKSNWREELFEGSEYAAELRRDRSKFDARREADRTAAYKDKKKPPKLNINTEKGGKLSTSSDSKSSDLASKAKNIGGRVANAGLNLLTKSNPIAFGLNQIRKDVMKGHNLSDKEWKNKPQKEIKKADEVARTKNYDKTQGADLDMKKIKQMSQKTQTQTKTQPKTQTQTQTKTQPKPETKTQTQTKTQPKPETKTQTQTETQTKTAQKTPPSPTKTTQKSDDPKRKRRGFKIKLGGIGGAGGTTKALGGHISKARDPNESLEIVCDYLIQEGYAETGPQAEAMYDHMSPEFMTYIHDQF